MGGNIHGIYRFCTDWFISKATISFCLIVRKSIISFNNKKSLPFLGVGNVSSAAEFNFWWDPEAAYIVLDSFKCHKTVLPWEGCLADSIALPVVR